MIRLWNTLFKPSLTKTPLLGRWKLTQGTLCEEIKVFNANRDHCGDKLCGNQYEYKNMVPKKEKNNKTTQK